MKRHQADPDRVREGTVRLGPAVIDAMLDPTPVLVAAVRALTPEDR